MEKDVKEQIVEAAKSLLMKEKVKKLTVKDIVERCHITRQSFYYHFENLPDLLRWVLKRKKDKLLTESLYKENTEEGLRSLFLLGLNIRPYVEHSLQTNYRDEIESLIEEQFFDFFMEAAERRKLYQKYSPKDVKFVAQYHSRAVLGILKNWNVVDDDLDHIVQTVHQIVFGEAD